MPKVPGSGIKKGQRKTFNRDLKELILSRGRPVDLLCNVSRGLKIRVGPQAGPGEPTYVYPDLQTRLYAARTLLAKVLPDMKAQELTGPDGAPLIDPSYHDELFSKVEVARRIAFVLAGGLEAKRELDGMDGVDTEAQFIPKPEPEPEPEPETATEAPEPPVEPAEPPLPKHAYIYIEEGERERSGERAWLAMAGRGEILNTFHGTDARQKARDWVGMKFNASPAKEIEVPLPDGEHHGIAD